MNKDESKIKVGLDFAKSFPKISLSITDDYYNNFESRQSSTLVSALKLSGAKRALLLAVCPAPETHFNLQEIVSLMKINEMVDYTFAGDLNMLNLMTGVGSHASNKPCAYYISASKPWDSGTSLRTLNLNARQSEK